MCLAASRLLCKVSGLGFKGSEGLEFWGLRLLRVSGVEGTVKGFGVKGFKGLGHGLGV